MRWNFFEAWPTKWDRPDFNAKGNDVAIETLELVAGTNREGVAMFQTEYEFTLPLGYVDEEGTLHRDGMMRLATAADEILPLKDPRVQQNEAYLIVILLSRVITRLGSVAQINPKVIEGLYAADLAYLQEFYNRINRNGKASVDAAVSQVRRTRSQVELERRGGVLGYPLERCTRR